VAETKSPDDEADPKTSSLDGVVDSVNGSELVVNNQSIDITSAEVNGTPRVGAVAKVEGYYDANGVFIVTKIEFESNDSGNVSSSDSSDNKKEDQQSSEDDKEDDNSSPESGGDH
jgi:hypothetical protein